LGEQTLTQGFGGDTGTIRNKKDRATGCLHFAWLGKLHRFSGGMFK
jgi:hypothetical protein